MYYFPSQPPYLLIFIGLFMAVTSGAALSGTLKTIVIKWRKEGGANSGSRLSSQQLLFPFLGITLGVNLFLCSGLAVFGFPNFLACAVGIPLSLLTCALVWFQLGSMLTYAGARGMQSLDLDSMS
ncbi:hypothetical protein [Calothrix sp. 336/3]|uniref:hypothetical protein n=1 Tax=Calothrix sp. 336/3 TaxID=1337936 RepID=UPI0004E2988C|nr:hypothetical protein [Calothrix sp. 336/3]AKG21023.1 hypothetical protein IJ00_06670 [Calothrix sp. 336/3]